MMKVLTMVHGFESTIVTVYVPAAKLFLTKPAVLPSLQVKEIGCIPPTKFRLMLPSLAP